MHSDDSRTPRLHPRTRSRRLRLVAAAWLSVAGSLTWSGGSALANPVPAASSAGLTWSALSPATHPDGLVGASETFDPANQTIVLFGGRAADGQLSSSTWIWNGSTWNESSTHSSPPPREYASMAFDGPMDQLILFGGAGTDGKLLDDTWTWNGASWNEVTTSATPGAREGAALAPDAAGHLVLFGGYGASNGQAPPPTTTTTTTTPKRHKRKKKAAKRAKATRSTTTTTTTPSTTSTGSTTTTSTTVPSSTTSSTGSTTTTTTTSSTTGTSGSEMMLPNVATAAWIGTSLPSAGTTSDPGVLDDTWILERGQDGDDQWAQATNTSNTPPARVGATMAYASGSKTVLFGGSSKAPGGAQRSGALGDTWTWNGHSWAVIKAKKSPAARMNAVMDDDWGSEGLGNAVLFGGIGRSTTFSDTWLWDGSGWLELKPASPATARSAAAGAFDATDGQLVVFGGISAAGKVLADTQVLTTHPPKRITLPPVTTKSGSSSSTTAAGGAKAKSKTGNSTTGTAGSKSDEVHRGDVITLSGTGFLPDAEITITFHSTPVLVARIKANAKGDFTANVNVPSTASGGDHHFEASGMGPKGIIQLATPVRVIGVSLAKDVARWIKLTLVGIAIAIPVVSWFVVGAFSRRRTPARV
jgi:hypothetical protein